MSNVLFVTWDGGGNVPPALGIAALWGTARPLVPTSAPLPRWRRRQEEVALS